jgi:hypothetical protein
MITNSMEVWMVLFLIYFFYVYVKNCFKCKLDFGQTIFCVYFMMFLPKENIKNKDKWKNDMFLLLLLLLLLLLIFHKPTPPKKH